MGRKAAKMEGTTTIQISIKNSNKLYNVQQALAKILHKKHVTPDQALSVFFVCRPIDVMLQEMMLEEGIEHAK